MALVALLFFIIGVYELVLFAGEKKKYEIIIYSALMAVGIALSVAVAVGIDIYTWQEWISDFVSKNILK